jgi:hypothetical protein
MRIFSEKPVPRMNCIDIADLRGADDPIDFQVAVRTRRPADTDRFICQLDVQRVDIRLGINGDSWYPEFFAGADNPQCDLAAIGDQDFIEHNYFTLKSG